MIARVIRRLYVHNFRCLENFNLPIEGQSSVLLVGKNGSGKTTVGLALEILQKIARGVNRVDDLVKPKDLSRGRADIPMRFELDVDIEGKRFEYAVAFEFPAGFKELRVAEEGLSVAGITLFSRAGAQVSLAKANPGQEKEAKFRIDWHLVALPIVQEQSDNDPLFIFKKWLARMLVLRPSPTLIDGESTQETLEPNLQVTDFGAWFSGVLAHTPAAYTTIDTYLKSVMPDWKEVRNPIVGKDSRSLIVRFATAENNLSVPFADLSDGEKCFLICALVIAANEHYGPLFCFWDEPDNYLAPSEVGHFIVDLRKAFQKDGQLVATSHDSEAIRRFSDENTLLLYRKSHLEPTIIRSLEESNISGNVIDALIAGDWAL